MAKHAVVWSGMVAAWGTILGATAAKAQEAPEGPVPPPVAPASQPAAPASPSTPPRPLLPPFTLGAGPSQYLASGKVVLTPGATGPPTFHWGDVTLTADRIEFDYRQQTLDAVGKARFVRGDEIIEGNRIHLDGASGTLDVESATAVTPPYRLSGKQLRRDPKRFTIFDATLGVKPEGGGEVGFRADEIRLANASRLTLINAKLSLYGVRLFTLRHLTIPVTLDPEYGGTGQSTAPPPVTFRLSGISGQAIGFGNQFGISSNTSLGVQFEQTTRRGFQYTLSTETELVGPRLEDKGRQLTATPGGRGERIEERRRRQARGETETETVSPLRQLLTARKPPPVPDEILDWVDILPSASSLSRPTRAPGRFLDLATTYSHNREFGTRRQAPLLLSREPEAQLVGNIPLYSPLDVSTTEATRQGLRAPRYYALGELTTGSYYETRLKENFSDVRGPRTGAVIGIGTLPILVGRRTLIGGQTAIHGSLYRGGETYTFSETNLNIEYVFKARSAVGAALVRRITTGSTPFLFDQIDTQNEAQFRFQTTAGKESRYTLALLTRFDLAQQALFDIEVAVARRGAVLEPRFTYKRLNGQLGFNLALIGLTQR